MTSSIDASVDTARRKMIIVVGMHRSGTSAMTRMLNLLGASLGSHLLEAQVGINDQGFWEHHSLVQINEQLLAALGRSWYDPRPLPKDWLRTPEVVSLAEDAKQFLREEFKSDSLAALKDPRLCLLLPFWLQALDQLGWESVVVMVIRNPNEVAASLSKREPFSNDFAHLLWSGHVLASLEVSADRPCALVDYRDLLEGPLATADRLSASLGIHWPVAQAQYEPAIRCEIDPSLYHQRPTKAADTPLSELSDYIYSLLTDSINCPGLEARGFLSQRLKAVLAHVDTLPSVLADAVARLVAVNQELHRLGQSHQLALDTLALRDRQLSEVNAVLDKIGREHGLALATIAERDQQLAEANQNLIQIGAQHGEALATLTERDRQLAEANSLIAQIGAEHALALATLSERDRQLAEANSRIAQIGAEHALALETLTERDQQLAGLGAEHGYALQVIEERDHQLSLQTGRLAQAGKELEHAQSVVRERDAQLAELNGRLNKIFSHPVLRLQLRLFHLGE